MIQAITYVFNLIKVGKKYAFNYLQNFDIKNSCCNFCFYSCLQYANQHIILGIGLECSKANFKESMTLLEI